MASFPDDLHPQNGFKLRFSYFPIALEYLFYFKIIQHTPPTFTPLNLTFNSFEDLRQYLIDKDILSYEIADFSPITDENVTRIARSIAIVDTKKIFDVEETTTKYLLRYKYYSVNQVADILSMSRPTVYKLLNDQSLKSVRINGQIRVNHMDLMNFINSETNSKLCNI